jgi:hypothetical protein
MANKKKTNKDTIVMTTVMPSQTITREKLALEQALLDKHKYFKSVEAKKDMSGSMPYCYGCRYRRDDYCTISHDERTIRNACSANCYGIRSV